MSLTGNSSYHAFKHDLIESLEHRIDKAILGARKEIIFVPMPVDRSLEFRNEFPDGLSKKGTYLSAQSRKVQNASWKPEEWEKSGNLSSFSVASEVGVMELKKFGEKKIDLPISAPLPVPVLTGISGEQHFQSLCNIRAESSVYHRFGKGAGGRDQWKKTPVSTSTVQWEGEEDSSADPYLDTFQVLLEAAKIRDELKRTKHIENAVSEIEAAAAATVGIDSPEEKEKGKAHKKKRVSAAPSDLRRYTVNSSPPLARAMLKALLNKTAGATEETLRCLLIELAPKVVEEFQRITGRCVVGVSIHWDSDLPHLNLWHTGLEKVEFQHKGKTKVRFRRTAMNLNSSGGLLAWDRTERAFARLGENLHAFSPVTVDELRKGEARAHKRQNRPAGDIALNRFFDVQLEAELIKSGYEKEIGEGFHEFVENEKRRYSAGAAGKGARSFRQLIERKTELENKVGSLESMSQQLTTEKAQKAKLEKSLRDAEKDLAQASGAFQEMDAKYSALEKAHATLKQRFNALRDAAYAVIQLLVEKLTKFSGLDLIKSHLKNINSFLDPEMPRLEIKPPPMKTPVKETPPPPKDEAPKLT